MNSDEDDLYESNSSESSPPRETQISESDVNNEDETDEAITENFDKLFEKFVDANSAKSIVKTFQNITDSLKIDTQDVFENGYSPPPSAYHPQKFNHNNSFQNHHLQQQHSKQQQQLIDTRLIYQIIKSKTSYWKANTLWKTYDKLAELKEYKKSVNSKALNVLIIGGGPVGLRLAIECALLGLKCTVVEKRDKFSRNNVLHLWPFTIVDLKNLGAKMFYGKFCAGSIDHISIRKLQCILLKAALLFGVQVHFNTSFEELVEPISSDASNSCWKIKVIPENHPVAEKPFDVVIGADGRRNTLPGFNRKEFRGRLAIGITANFVNYKTTQEAKVEERSGVSFIFDQKFFLDLRAETNIDLENIVYYKDDTHYFVMTAKRQSLIEKGVILKDHPDAAQLLSKDNVNFDALCDYAKLAAYVSTNRKLKTLVFAKNHYGQADVAMFDFTSLFQSENATRIIERKGKKLFMSLVGDSLLEPFWPTGTGIARGFLAVFDTAWAIKRFANDHKCLEILCERESIYQLLSQTTHNNLNKNYHEYTIDPSTRYINLNWSLKMFNENQVKHLYDYGTQPLASIENSMPQNKRIKNEGVHSQTLLRWCQMVVQPYGLRIENFTTAWKDGLAFCAIIHRFRSDLIDYTNLSENSSNENIKKLIEVMREKLNLGSVSDSEELISNGITKRTTVLMILDKLYSIFKNNQLNDIENKFEVWDDDDDTQSNHKRKYFHDDLVVMRKQQRPKNDSIKVDATEDKFNPNKRNSLKHISVNGIAQILKSKIEKDVGTNESIPAVASPRPKSVQQMISPREASNINSERNSKCMIPSHCYICRENVSIMERQNVLHLILHTNCFRCYDCKRRLDSSAYEHVLDSLTRRYIFYCTHHKPITENFRRIHSLQPNNSYRKPEFMVNKPDVVVDDIYNAFELPKKKAVSSNSNSDSASPSPSPPQRNLSRRSNFFNQSPDLNDKFDDYLIAPKFNTKTPERAEFELAADNLDFTDDENEDSNEEDEVNSDTYSESNENDSGDSKLAFNNNIQSDTSESDLSDDMHRVNERITLPINSKPVLKKATEEVANEIVKDSEPIEMMSFNDMKLNSPINISSRPLSRPLSCLYNYTTPILDDYIRENKIFSSPKTESPEESKSSFLTSSPMTASTHSALSSTGSSKLKKFNVDITSVENKSSEDEELKRKQELIRIENETEREKNRQIIRDLVTAKDLNLNKTSSPGFESCMINTNTPEDHNRSPKNVTSLRKSFLCQVCNKSASITERVRLQGLVYHRECIRCCKCNIIVKNAENFTRKNANDQIDFYCVNHAAFKSIGENLSVCTIDVDDDEILTGSNLKKSESTVNSEQSKILLDTQLIRQRALEKARLKSDEELGLKIKNDFTIPSRAVEIRNSASPKLEDRNIRKLEFVDKNYKFETSQSRDGVIINSQMYETKTETDSESDEERGMYESRTEEDDLFIDDENNVMKKLILDDFDKNYSQTMAIEKKKDSPAPLAKSETFEANEELRLKSKTPVQNTKWYGLGSFETPSNSSESSASKAKQSLKLKLSKLLAPSVLTSPNTSNLSESPPLLITTSAYVTLSSKKNANLTSPKITSSNNGILKSIFNTKSANRGSTGNQESNKVNEQKNTHARKKIIPNITADLSDSSRTNSANSSTISSTSSLNDDSFNSQDNINDVNKKNFSGNSFNALNVANSPRLSRNSRRAKLNHKRQQNEEKRIEKQRRDQRSRTSQDLQRKLDEIHTRSNELEKEGNRLEMIISCHDKNDKKNKHGEKKIKLEQELYNVIHQRNLLARCENKLNIQGRALGIEDKLSDCQQRLRESIAIPESEKTIEQIESEKKIMEQIVEYIEEKNQLVEQLESLRILEREEDSEIIKIFSTNFYNSGEAEIMSKFEPYADII